jgi:hypothetical protein
MSYFTLILIICFWLIMLVLCLLVLSDLNLVVYVFTK